MGEIVFLYPGQGAQEVGMGFDLLQRYPSAREIFNQANHLLGFSLSCLCLEGPEKELNKDLNAQLAVYTISCIITDILKNHGIIPDAVSGYSSGFYAAGYAAGCFDFSSGLDLVRCAGEILLEEGLKFKGGMAVIFGLSQETVEEICRRIENVDVAIVNTTRQIIVSGSAASVEAVMAVSLHEGALDAYRLTAATAYHSGFMKNGGLRFLRKLENRELFDPQIPIVSYQNLEWITDKYTMTSVMADQLSGPVRWVDLVKKMGEYRKTIFFEVGPGNIIFRTVKWIDRNTEIFSTASNDRLIKAIEGYRRLKKNGFHSSK
jgi:[acyl-carrier-protein] S-malonyltransferase